MPLQYVRELVGDIQIQDLGANYNFRLFWPNRYLSWSHFEKNMNDDAARSGRGRENRLNAKIKGERTYTNGVGVAAFSESVLYGFALDYMHGLDNLERFFLSVNFSRIAKQL